MENDFHRLEVCCKELARLPRIFQMQAGGGPSERPLSDLEERLMGILGNIVVNGLGVEEMEITRKDNEKDKEDKIEETANVAEPLQNATRAKTPRIIVYFPQYKQ
ncbi:hypothetical protein ILUMI_17390 [Ignelater luminosus]|uniref:Uncharacterized protein n=1 Tax=Ignelater luminosus TaxID=2038154 RepID=A0A8K0CQJ1_IGNLU|nr:hypothetical protein ILUMI_17390 [Ignelater luminosus]